MSGGAGGGGGGGLVKLLIDQCSSIFLGTTHYANPNLDCRTIVNFKPLS